ncbi:hypothetical protein DBR37_06040 [Herminiimonas sp. KBW02]|nr:hypothetical protein DBR37_06040 [Herminiimonas sp. KBW02]
MAARPTRYLSAAICSANTLGHILHQLIPAGNLSAARKSQKAIISHQLGAKMRRGTKNELFWCKLTRLHMFGAPDSGSFDAEKS